MPRNTAKPEAERSSGLKVLRDDCLNRRHRSCNCTLCLACPTAAIRLNGGRPMLDDSRCVECGLCLSICPTDVYRSEQMGDSAIVGLGQHWGEVELGCQRRTALTTTRTTANGLARLPCLARLSPELLVGIAAQHSRVWLDDSLCGACPIGTAHSSILNAVRIAKELLQAWGRSERVHLYTESEGKLSDVPAPFPNSPTSGAPVSRRSFLSLLTLNAGQALTSLAASKLPADSPPEPRLSPRVATLKQALARLGAPQSDVSSPRMATLEIDDRCTACGLCAKVCPTHAIEFQAQGEHFSLTFNPADCLGLDCKLCDWICAPRAITLRPGLSRAALAMDFGQVVHDGPLARCARCHLPFAARGAETLCPFCRAEENRSAGANRI